MSESALSYEIGDALVGVGVTFFSIFISLMLSMYYC